MRKLVLFVVMTAGWSAWGARPVSAGASAMSFDSDTVWVGDTLPGNIGGGGDDSVVVVVPPVVGPNDTIPSSGEENGDSAIVIIPSVVDPEDPTTPPSGVGAGDSTIVVSSVDDPNNKENDDDIQTKKTAIPVFSIFYNDGMTQVEMSTETSDALIYYTVDGSEPSEKSELYKQPLTFTSDNIVRAIAIEEKLGASEIVTESIVVKTKLPTPTYEVSQEYFITKVFIKAPVDDAVLYFNEEGHNDVSRSYICDPDQSFSFDWSFFCFAGGERYLPSDPIFISVKILRRDAEIWSHLTFQNWSTEDLIKDKYYDFYKEIMVDGTTIQVPTDSLTTRSDEEGWEIGSWGQRVYVQSKEVIGDASDYISDYVLIFGERKNEEDPANAYIQSTQKYGRFSLKFYVDRKDESVDSGCLDILFSHDGENWTLYPEELIYKYRLCDNVECIGVSDERCDSPVYLKIQSATTSYKTETAIYDIIVEELLGLPADDGGMEIIGSVSSDMEPIVKYYDLMGRQIDDVSFVKGFVIRTFEYNDGTRKGEKTLLFK